MYLNFKYRLKPNKSQKMLLEHHFFIVNQVKIHPAYTSQRCFSCGHIERKNRQGQANFKCKSCGHKDNADKNAAKNILHYEEWAIDQLALLEQKALAQA